MASVPAYDISASGRTSGKLNLTALQSNMKADPEGYSSEVSLVYNQFKSSIDIFEEKARLNFTSLSGISADSSVGEDLGDQAMFLAHVTPFYPTELAQFPIELIEFLRTSAWNLPSGVRVQVTRALILLVNRQMIDISKTLLVFMEVQTLGDKVLRQLAFYHVIKSIRRMNQKHKNDPKNRTLQNILFGMLQQEEEAKAKRALITLCDLYRRKVWCDDRTSNAICMACFHPSSRIKIAALSFLLDFEKIKDDHDSSDSEDDQHQIVLNKEAMYKASHKGTTSSKKKKNAKLQRIARSMRRLSSGKSNSNICSPLNNLKDAQGFSEKLFFCLQSGKEKLSFKEKQFSCLQSDKERLSFEKKLFSWLQSAGKERLSFEVKTMMLKVIARTIGLHHLIFLEFYPYLQKYVQPSQQHVTTILSAAVQACHEMVPPDAVKSLFKQIVNQFIHDGAGHEAITVGLNVVREICLRMPLLMTEELLRDLVLYRKSHEKGISASARSLLILFREVCPSLLMRKDRGRPAELKAKPKAFGEVRVHSNILGVELLEEEEDQGSSDEDIDGETQDHSMADDSQEDDSVDLVEEDGRGESDSNSDHELDDGSDANGEDDIYYNVDGASEIGNEDESDENDDDDDYGEIGLVETDDGIGKDAADVYSNKSKEKKRKFSEFEGQLNAADKSLGALKKLSVTAENISSSTHDGILSDEDFRRIKELKAKKDARTALTQHGFKLPSSDQLRLKRVDAATCEAHIKRKLTEEAKLALIREGREERGKYQSRAAIKKKKTGGLSNRQKEHKKLMPDAARKAKIARTRQAKKIKQKLSGKQFRGRKAWK
ncbi:uncharacterized protein LOC131019673 [Salvia miltiorrhiza]|uniref:uncharacterized protein LOC131019673 n=1 Tax=Salvia miltiorrhiza TaxID=226208 RepID=UPI0025ACB82F|nr:uncharacterized protein LOC131019673 [Salvia miltiorrhiza]